MRKWRALAALGLTLGLAACGDPLAAERARLQPLIGQSEQVLIANLGVPSRSIQSGDVTYLAYIRQRPVLIPGTPGFYGPGWGAPWGMPGWYAPPGYFPPQVIVQHCEATFAVTKGIVDSVAVRGNGCG
ncbi:MAG: hypothetical protein KGL12_00565 [Rhodospirillales bacterium]|nr:hypothetical protein [Rhodospirillales bacterium]